MPNVVLITVDALRPDHLGCYGYARNTSPNIDNLAKQGVCFLNCFSPGSSTTSAMPSFLSGKYLNIYNKEAVFNAGLKNILDQKFTLLSEYLKHRGYYTAAFVTNGHLGPGSGFEQGFSRYHFDFKTTDGKDLTSEVLCFLSGYHGKKPLFIWVHYMDTHIPYKHENACLGDFKNDFLYAKENRKLRVTPIDTFNKSQNAYSSDGNLPRAAHIGGKSSLNYYVMRYDAEIRYLDDQVGRLLEHLRKNSIIIISSDHGESLGEHNRYFAHGENIFDEALRVPLIIKDTGLFRGGFKIDAAVSSVDIVPTILSRVNPPWYFFNKNKFDGIDLKSVILGKNKKRKYIYSFFPWAFSIRDAGRSFKFILNQDGGEELYFLPDENTNLIAAGSREADLIKSELKSNLLDWLKHRPVRCDINVERTPLSDEERDNLKSLGYLQ
ncbi:MAG: sulfatase [Candidatus Omnitrophica bacterium]|nr:sulfatase [Candidatus Omnitrophota bacterium]